VNECYPNSTLKCDLVTAGHIVLDFIEREGRAVGPQPGGPCIYSSLAARSLEARAGVVSKVGEDFRESHISWMKRRGISVDGLKIVPSPTTRFQIRYMNGNRRMKVTSVCDSLKRIDFLHVPRSRAIHIGSVLHEIPFQIARRLAESDSIVGLDPQGYVRRLGANGTVGTRKWRQAKLLARIDVLKVSEGELPAIVAGEGGLRSLRKLGSGITLLTRGSQGTVIASKEHGTFHVPAFPVRVRSPTGAGDAELGAFLVTWVRTHDLLWSAAVGVSASSFLIERTGLGNLPGRKQIERRAGSILEQIKRIKVG